MSHTRITTERLISFIQENMGLNKINSSEEQPNETVNKELFKNLEFGNFQNLSFLESEFNEILNEYSLNLTRYGVIYKETIGNMDDVNTKNLNLFKAIKDAVESDDTILILQICNNAIKGGTE